MAYTDLIKSYSNNSGEFTEKVCSVKEQQELAKKLGITEDDYPEISRPIFKEQSKSKAVFTFFIRFFYEATWQRK